MAHITRIIYSNDNTVFNYTAFDRADFLHAAMQKYGWPLENWGWQTITPENQSEFFPADNPPAAFAASQQHQLGLVAVTRAGKTAFFTTGDPDRPDLLAVAWEWITDGAEQVEEWQGEFVLTKGQGREFRRFDHIGSALDAAEKLREWDIFLTDASGQYGGAPLFSG